jgi:ABC-type lipoprotein release transport system permease subunit
MKFPVFLRISLKYLWRYRRRYLFLFLALGFGFGVLSVISSLKDGMKENLYLSAQTHYAGDIIAAGYDSTYHLTKTEQDAIFAAAEAIKLNPVFTAVRTTLHSMKEGSIFFNGNTLALKHIIGVDWDVEKAYLEQFSYTEPPAPFEEMSILLSRPIAEELGARQGDSLTLEVLTATGQKNTGTFVAAGIVEDSSLFGYYKVYVSRLTLNRLVGFADGDCSIIGFFLKNQRSIETNRQALYTELETRINTGPLIYDRDTFYKESQNVEGGIKVLLLTLPVYLSEVAQLMDAIDLASYVLFAMMLAIIMVSAVVTCRLILHERTRETGTMRAIGFYESDLRMVLQLEMAAMAVVSMAAGFLLALLINRLLSYTSFGWFPGFEVFTQNGRLAARYLPRTIIVNILTTGCTIALAIGGQIFRNSRNPLPEMLSGGAL